MDDKSKTGKGDDSRINVNEEYEVQYWSKKFGVTPDELKEAVKAVGSQAILVDEYLGSSK
jgi:hypothetical protein